MLLNIQAEKIFNITETKKVQDLLTYGIKGGGSTQ